MAQSRIEKILENILGAENEIEAPMSRNETLLIAIMEMLEGVPDTAITSAQIDAIIASIE